MAWLARYSGKLTQAALAGGTQQQQRLVTSRQSARALLGEVHDLARVGVH